MRVAVRSVAGLRRVVSHLVSPNMMFPTKQIHTQLNINTKSIDAKSDTTKQNKST
jgi:hypothetical protein